MTKTQLFLAQHDSCTVTMTQGRTRNTCYEFATEIENQHHDGVMLWYSPQTRSRLAPSYVEWCKPKRDASKVASDGHTRGFIVPPTHVELATLHTNPTQKTISQHTWSPSIQQEWMLVCSPGQRRQTS